MTGTKIYNACWLAVWLLCFGAAVWGATAGHRVYWLFAAVTLYSAYFVFTDDEGGESLKQSVTRKTGRTCLWKRRK